MSQITIKNNVLKSLVRNNKALPKDAPELFKISNSNLVKNTNPPPNETLQYFCINSGKIEKFSPSDSGVRKVILLDKAELPNGKYFFVGEKNSKRFKLTGTITDQVITTLHLESVALIED